MSREWQRARLLRFCGGCGQPIAVGDAVVVVRADGQSWVKVRCEACDGPAPPDLPARVELRVDKPTTMTRLEAVAGRFVYPVVEREPGEEAEHMKSRRAPKPKRVAYTLIDPDNEAGAVIYARLRALISAHHTELLDARIALAWNTAWKPDVDGRCTLGMCKRASDLDRELAAFDFVIVLRREFWDAPSVGERQKNALLDHELSHATVAHDIDGEPKLDERGRVVYRIRKHDVEEFGAVVGRWGLYKRDLEWFIKQVPSTPAPLTPSEEADIASDASREREWYR